MGKVRASISRHLVLKLYYLAIVHGTYVMEILSYILQDNDLSMRLQFIIGGPNQIIT